MLHHVIYSQQSECVNLGVASMNMNFFEVGSSWLWQAHDVNLALSVQPNFLKFLTNSCLELSGLELHQSKNFCIFMVLAPFKCKLGLLESLNTSSWTCLLSLCRDGLDKDLYCASMSAIVTAYVGLYCDKSWSIYHFRLLTQSFLRMVKSHKSTKP